jgi:hypothetical protein
VEVLLRLGRTPGAAGKAALEVLALVVAATEPSLRLPEAVVAAGGVEAALAQLAGPAAQEQQNKEAAGGAAGLLYYLMERSGPAASEECQQRVPPVLAAGGMARIVQCFVRSMAAGGGSRWQPTAAHLILNLLMLSSGEMVPVPTSSSFCSWAKAMEAVEAGVVPVVLGCLARSRHTDDEFVQSGRPGCWLRWRGRCGAAAPAATGSCRRRCGRGALQPALAALAGLLRSTQLTGVAAEVLIALGNISLVDKALAVEAGAAGAAQLATQWSRRPGVQERVVQAAEWLLEKLAFTGDAVPADAIPVGLKLSSYSCVRSAAGQGGGQATCCAACGATSRRDGKALQMCSAHRRVSYCSGACQRRHWGEHKGACRRVG